MHCNQKQIRAVSQDVRQALADRSEGFNGSWLHHKFSTITQAVFKQPRMRLKRRQALQKFVSKTGMIGTSLLLVLKNRS